MRLQRYILAELLAAFALIALIITGVLFAAMMLRFLHQLPDLSLFAVLRAAPYIAPVAFPITLPLSFLVACLLTYGRFSDDNEFLALQMGGIHPWRAAAPAVAVGSILAVATVLLNTDVIPVATLAQKEIARGEIRQILKAVDDPGRDNLLLGGFQMSWRGRDAKGLKSVLITWSAERLNDAGELVRTSQRVAAGRGRVDVSRIDDDQFFLDLDDVEMTSHEGEQITRIREANRVVAVSIDELAGVAPMLKSKRSDEMSGDQLWYRARRLREIAAADGATRGDLTQMRSYEAEYWRRIALGLAPLAFACVGIGLGLAGGKGSRTAAFLTAILIALPVYYPLLYTGANLARSGALPAGIALNLGNIVIAAGGIWKFKRVIG
ncbi:MAG: LptF/LptG family permease [Planctomycetes bacterium]|nr:LptF/LptG family permease [Planctomycetota bacterium]